MGQNAQCGVATLIPFFRWYRTDCSGWEVTNLAKNRVLMGHEVEVEGRAVKAMGAWHRDRLEWSDRALRALMLVNAGGAVAAAAFIGTYVGASIAASAQSVEAPRYVLLCIGAFLMGLVLPLCYIMYRFLWAEYRVWYLRSKRSDLWDAEKDVDLGKIKTNHPPTRPQLLITYVCNAGSLLFFMAGLVLGLMSLDAL